MKKIDVTKIQYKKEMELSYGTPLRLARVMHGTGVYNFYRDDTNQIFAHANNRWFFYPDCTIAESLSKILNCSPNEITIKDIRIGSSPEYENENISNYKWSYFAADSIIGDILNCTLFRKL